jgi:glycine/D-amino acid oxidase-like deaminating enzyme
MNAKRIVIIGGGFAGLAAGVELSERGATAGGLIHLLTNRPAMSWITASTCSWAVIITRLPS